MSDTQTKSPMLTQAALDAALLVSGREQDEEIAAFLAAQDRDALAAVASRLIGETLAPGQASWAECDEAARAVIDALLGSERPVDRP